MMKENEKKISFFKKLIISIKDIEKYPELASENWSVVLAYLLKLLAIFSIIATISFTYIVLKKMPANIDIGEASNTSQNVSQQIILINELVTEISNNYNGVNQNFVYAGLFAFSYMYIFVMCFLSISLDILLLGTFGYLTAIILRMHLKFSAMCKIATHSLTLPVLLNAIHILLQTFAQFEIKYFDVMYIGIAYVYIIAVILIIKADLIKNQQELTKIIQEQEKIRQELERKKQEEEDKKEEDKRNKEKEEKRKKEKEQEKKKDGDEGNIGSNEPQGDNA